MQSLTTRVQPGPGAPGDDGASFAALEALYRQDYVMAVRLARLLTGDWHRAEELAQEAFIRIAPRLEGTDNPSAYLKRILVNLCRDDGRRAGTVRRNPPPAPGTTGPPRLPPDLDEVWLAVQRLPPRRRDAVVLRYWADLPTDEIAQLLGTRPATARSLIHRGLATLKVVLADD